MTQLPRHLLPASLLQLADYCGDDVMWALWDSHGGGHLRIPLRYDAAHPLNARLGPVGFARLVDSFGGEILTIPRADAARRAVRDALIRQGRAAGRTLFELARQYQLTERQITTICRARDSPIVNGDLFG